MKNQKIIKELGERLKGLEEELRVGLGIDIKLIVDEKSIRMEFPEDVPDDLQKKLIPGIVEQVKEIFDDYEKESGINFTRFNSYEATLKQLPDNLVFDHSKSTLYEAMGMKKKELEEIKDNFIEKLSMLLQNDNFGKEAILHFLLNYNKNTLAFLLTIMDVSKLKHFHLPNSLKNDEEYNQSIKRLKKYLNDSDLNSKASKTVEFFASLDKRILVYILFRSVIQLK